MIWKPYIITKTAYIHHLDDLLFVLHISFHSLHDTYIVDLFWSIVLLYFLFLFLHDNLLMKVNPRSVVFPLITPSPNPLCVYWKGRRERDRGGVSFSVFPHKRERTFSLTVTKFKVSCHNNQCVLADVVKLTGRLHYTRAQGCQN